ncbi:MAG: class I SAM-dependent methyltransferase [Algoriphagus sp.]|nr:class I SAM-dependent methyltransferase [Algoriphagus sp.]
MNKCKFCESNNHKFFEAKERMLGLGGDFTYAECLSCGSLQLDQIPEDLSPYYSSSNYYSFGKLVESDLKIRILKAIRMRAFLLTGNSKIAPSYGYWLRKVHPGFGTKIADVGCGNGQLLYELFASGYSDLHGFDPFIDKSLKINSSLQLNKQKIEETDLNFDLIMMHHAFEHMEDGGQILKTCFDKLNPGGKLLVRTPVTDGEVWKTKRELWVQLDAPRHLIIPSISGFKTLAEKVGFRLDEVEFDSTSLQFWGTALYEKGLPLDQRTLGKHFDHETMKAFTEKANLYNQESKGDQVCFYLTKG